MIYKAAYNNYILELIFALYTILAFLVLILIKLYNITRK